MKLNAGEKYGMLTVLHRVHAPRYLVPHYICLCECGMTSVVSGKNLARGNTKSCGCLKRGRPKKIRAGDVA